VAARLPARDASELSRRLGRNRIIVAAARHGNLRVSPHFYNDEFNIAALAAAI